MLYTLTHKSHSAGDPPRRCVPLLFPAHIPLHLRPLYMLN